VQNLVGISTVILEISNFQCYANAYSRGVLDFGMKMGEREKENFLQFYDFYLNYFSIGMQ